MKLTTTEGIALQDDNQQPYSNIQYIAYYPVGKTTTGITDESYSTEKMGFNKISWLTINLSNNYFTYPLSYESYLEEAKKQPQPKL